MKKALSILMVAAILTASMAGAALANAETAPAEPGAYYLSVTGLVTGVEEQEYGLRVEIIMPAADRDGRAVLIITDATVFPFDSEINEGDTVTAFYLANAPMIMIYPPQYTAAVLVNGAPEGQNVVVDRFNPMENQEGRFLNQAGTIAFSVGDDTEIILADGTDFSDGDFAGRRIALIYDISTRSFPAQTTALKLIVLFEDIAFGPLPIDPGDLEYTPWTTLPHPVEPPIVPLPAPAPGHEPAVTLPAPAPAVPAVTLPAPAPPDALSALGWPVVVNGTQITAPQVFQTGDTVMVPLRAIAEALGYEVRWDGALKSVRLGVAVQTWIGSTEVHIGRMAPQNISTAPVIVNGSTYVPLDFFRAIGINNAYAFEGQIVIDNVNEPMQ